MNTSTPRPGRVCTCMPETFHDRKDAANQLVVRLAHYRHKHPLVLAIPRGAVPMAQQMADQFIMGACFLQQPLHLLHQAGCMCGIETTRIRRLARVLHGKNVS
jgi:hypothetical protein